MLMPWTSAPPTLRMEGDDYKTIEYVMEYDFVNNAMTTPGWLRLPGQPASAANVINVPAPTDLGGHFTRSHSSAMCASETRRSDRNWSIGQQPIPGLHGTFLNQDAYTGTFQ